MRTAGFGFPTCAMHGGALDQFTQTKTALRKFTYEEPNYRVEQNVDILSS